MEENTITRINKVISQSNVNLNDLAMIVGYLDRIYHTKLVQENIGEYMDNMGISRESLQKSYETSENTILDEVSKINVK